MAAQVAATIGGYAKRCDHKTLSGAKQGQWFTRRKRLLIDLK